MERQVGPGDIPVEAWKCVGEVAVEVLTTTHQDLSE